MKTEAKITDAQDFLRERHGTPAEFADACWRAVPSMISTDEAIAAIDKYAQEWNTTIGGTKVNLTVNR